MQVHRMNELLMSDGTGYYKQMTPGNKGHSAPQSASRTQSKFTRQKKINRKETHCWKQIFFTSVLQKTKMY